ncbi:MULTISPECIES: carboxylate-amine ligase [Actibacterium]|uniref:Putative glutamate--cysteine ligase 2 n=1 Tax=Actibacterium naphthalenivorans TaxID=1614693 RepID=A0A840CDF8_9RHOB|nr:MULTISPECIES: carboxylate-amine ligase [Actibacterium]ALG90590.1 carboxylate--amine ligase [Actibacterium sp. EMB200-NS6]MBB4023240.1 carboxylate-amine ligase [Actibacterium naphthalenivorans]
MSPADPDFTIGIEEEYLLVDCDTLALATAPDALMSACTAELEGQFSPEFLQCQVEIGTRVCRDIAEARDDLRRLRGTVARIAGDFGLAPIAVSCHPFSDWKDQHHTDKERYNTLSKDLAGVARRMLVCGMHVHVGIADQAMRIELMNQLTYFLPHLLALSTSSPFWQGVDTGLSSYRLTVFDNLPRTGLPPRPQSWADYQLMVDTLTGLNLIEDSSKIWWDLRPSARFPTIESRICDVSPRLENTLSLAALTQCITRMLYRLTRKNQQWRQYDTFLLAENRWRAQRYGVSEGLIDFGAGTIKPMPVLLDELIALVSEDAEALGCMAEVEAARDILLRGTSADQQRAAFHAARAAGLDRDEALQAVVRMLIDEFQQGL